MTGVDFADVTTLRLGGPATEVIEARSENELVEHVSGADADGIGILLLAGGSNVVVADAGYQGRTILVRTVGIEADYDDFGVIVTVAAGQNWDQFVSHAIDQRWVGIEALSGIPGSVGATPIQNVGAYGQEIAHTLVSVRAWDRRAKQIRNLSPGECEFGYRSSRFKTRPGRFVVLSVTFRFGLGDQSTPVLYPELARRLGVDVGQSAPSRRVRETVLELRGEKGMVLDPTDHDTWSTGSFFTNPVLTTENAAELPPDAPRFEQPGGRIKTSAAWLIEHAGFHKGYGDGRARVSEKHTLALTNRGGASTSELLDLARGIRDGVHSCFAIELANEPVLIGCSL